jgi:coatomer subunit beta
MESKDVGSKIEAVKKVILLLLNGERMPQMMMTVIKFCLTTQDHHLQKLLMLYWEVCEKYDSQGQLLPEMILVCNALRNLLNHANEFVRGCSLRFLCKMSEPQILEPLIASIKANLEHRVPYVRRQAILTMYSIFKAFPDMVPDACELVEILIQTETDESARRNAFLMLFHCDCDRAVAYLVRNFDQVARFGDGFQLVVLELARKVCRDDPSQKSRFVKCIFHMLNSESAAVSYEAAWTLVLLSSAPTAVRAAAQTYTNLLSSQSDNNVKLIVLERISALKQQHAKIVRELLMDIMRALNSPNLAIKQKVLDIALSLVSPRNIEELVMVLKKEVLKTQDDNLEGGGQYRQMLIKAIHSCAVKFPDIAESVVHLLLDFLDGFGAIEVVLFVREILLSYPNLRSSIVQKISVSLGIIGDATVFRVALWILAEFSEDHAAIESSFSAIVEELGSLPFISSEEKDDEEDAEDEDAAPELKTTVTVLADGTYATQTAMTEPKKEMRSDDCSKLRNLIIKGDFFLAACIAGALTKFIVKDAEFLASEGGWANQGLKSMQVKTMLIICGFVKLGHWKHAAKELDKDSFDRLSTWLSFLCNPGSNPSLAKSLSQGCREVFGSLVNSRRKENGSEEGIESKVQSQADSLISFRQLRRRQELGAVNLDDEGDLMKATGANEDTNEGTQKLNRVHQLTGFADSCYAEACVTVRDYDISMEILVINRTQDTLENITIELATLGDLKIVERPPVMNIGPFDTRTVKASIKVSSTETGHIFGNIVYDCKSGDKVVLNMNHVHIDIMDYIHPATCTEQEFRSMWAEFEWENKVAVNTTFTDLEEFLDHIIASTHMKSLTPKSALVGTCDFMAANLYAKSVFGEDALVNVSVGKQTEPEPKITGYVRIRSKTQGIALSLGERITLKQVKPDEEE